MTREVQLPDLSPLVFSQIVYFTLLGRLVWVLRPNCVDEVFSSKFKSAVQMRKLVTGPSVPHTSSFLQLVSHLINNEALIRNYSPDLVFSLLSTNNENFVLDLD